MDQVEEIRRLGEEWSKDYPVIGDGLDWLLRRVM
jgi:hypothetical protein